MANVDLLDGNGLQLKSYDVILSELENNMRSIYGEDINLESNSPDGQLLNILAQAFTDLREMLQRIYDILSLDTATGINLDRAVALIGITRRGGTRTVTPITITTSQALNLIGLDTDAANPYTIQDNAGNRWNLQNTHYFSGADTAVLNFQAETIGHQLTTPNTITTPVTIVLGVSSINNPSLATVIGEDEETDLELRSRAKRSIMLAAVGFVDSLYASLMNLDGMNSVRILENTTNTIDANGTSPHSIHVITAGSATSKDIATTILQKRSGGCGMDGNISYTLTNRDGTPIDIKWSTVVPRYVFAYATVSSLDGINAPNLTLIKTNLPKTYIPAVGETISTNQLISAITEIDSNAFVEDADFTFGQVQKFECKTLISGSGTPASTSKFKIKYNGNLSAEIEFSDSQADVTSKIQAVTGLSNVTVTWASNDLTISFADVSDILGPISIPYSNISDTNDVFAFKIAPQSTFKKSSSIGLQYQLSLTSDRISLSPLVVSPTAQTIAVGETQQFTAVGGDGNYKWLALKSDNSAYAGFDEDSDGFWSVDGLFTGASAASNIKIICIDGLGNVGQTTINVEA